MLPGGFSPREFYYARSQVARAYADGNVTSIAPTHEEDILGRLKRIIWSFGNEGIRFIREVFPPREAELLVALTFGVRTELPWEVVDAFRRSGLAHITVVSGLHLALLLSGLLLLLKVIGLRRRVALMIAVPMIGLFLLLVGPQVPILRSAVMAVLLMLGVFLDRPVDRLNVLALAALLILLPWSDELRQVSFQLSFLAVLSLVVVVPAASRILSLPTRVPWSYFAQLLVASLVVSTAIAPLTIYHFHLWSPVVVLGNFVAIPLLSFLLPTTYVFLLFHHFGLDTAANVLMPAVHSFVSWLLDVAESLASWPWGHVEVITLHIGLLSAVSLILLFISTPRARRSARGGRPWHPILVCLALAVAGIWYDVSSALCQPLRADFLALGQGDATFIRTSEGGTVLVDGGRPPREGGLGQTVPLVDYLLGQGIHRINLLVLTHPAEDHIGALPVVLAIFPVDLVLDCGLDGDTELWREYRRGVIRNGTRWEVVRAGDRITGLGDLQVEVLHPRGPRERHMDTESANEQCVVLLLSWRDLQIVLTGDIGFPSEEGLFASRPKANAVVLKVPHHGSRFSSSWEFIEDVDPTIAVAEVGRNPYGHPHERTIRRYHSMGVQFFRTDWNGSVRVVSNGSELRVVTTSRGSVYDYRPEEETASSAEQDAEL
jgi:competence protein ComEC